MGLYRVSNTWSNNLEERKKFILARLKDRIRAEAEKEEKNLLRNNNNAGGK